MMVNNERKPIVCLGILVADVVGRPVRVVPDPGRLTLVDEMSLHTGGCAANAATALARLGMPVELIGKVGDDPFGVYLKTELHERGIGTLGVKVDGQTGTSATMVMVGADGERRFIHYIGANARFTLQDVDMKLVSSSAILHIGGALVMPGIDGEPTAALLMQARQAGVITFLDLVWDDTGRWMKVVRPCLPHVDYFIPSLPEAQALTGLEDPYQVAQALLNEGVNTVGLKMGDEGCLVMNRRGQQIRLSAFQVEAIDATGAGDAYAAGFIAGIYLGWPLEKTTRFANAVGGLCVTGLGASGGIRSLDETLKFMDSTPLRSG